MKIWKVTPVTPYNTQFFIKESFCAMKKSGNGYSTLRFALDIPKNLLIYGWDFSDICLLFVCYIFEKCIIYNKPIEKAGVELCQA